MAKRAPTYVMKLYRLAKDGQKAKFIDAIEETQILRKLDQLDGFSASMIIYSFNKLKIMQQDVWKKLEELYLQKQNQMSMHDQIMCSQAFLGISNNKQIHTSLLNSLRNNLDELMTKQKQQPNLGLVAYIMAMNGVEDPEFWRKIEWLLLETKEFQDQRNITMLIFAFMKSNNYDEQTWDFFEKVLWESQLPNFLLKNKIILMHSFTKANKGSKKLWQYFEDDVLSLNLISKIDLKFIAWAFGKQSLGSVQLWKFIMYQLDKQLNQCNIDDIEFIFWAIQQSSTYQEFNESEIKEIWSELTKKKILYRQSDDSKHSIVDELCSIGRALEISGQQNSVMFKDIENRFFSQPDRLKQFTKRIWIMRPFFHSRPERFDQVIQQQLINRLMTNIQYKEKSIIEKVSLSGFNDLQDLCFLGNLTKCVNQQFWNDLAKVHSTISYNSLRDPNLKEKYMYTGSQIFQALEDKSLKQTIQNILSQEQVISDNFLRFRTFMPTMKVFSMEYDPIFIKSVIKYIEKNKDVRPEHLQRLFVIILTRNNLMIPLGEFYNEFKSLVNSLIQSPKLQQLMNFFERTLCEANDPQSLNQKLENSMQQQFNIHKLIIVGNFMDEEPIRSEKYEESQQQIQFEFDMFEANLGNHFESHKGKLSK